MLLTPLRIIGGQPLEGEITVQSSKNAALPIIVASLLSAEPIILHGIPRLADMYTLINILEQLGTQVTWLGEHTLRLHTPLLLSTEPPYELVSKMRASFNILGALIARVGEGVVGMPGGCTFGDRPVDQHIKAFEQFGIKILEKGGSFHAERTSPLSGTYVFEMLTVGATQNAIMCGVLGQGKITLDNASIDTDVVDMVNFLNSLGANIEGAGTHTITVHGVPYLTGGEYQVIPDRIEAGTLMIAAVATRGCITLRGVRTEHMRALIGKLSEMGASVLETEDHLLRIDARNCELKSVDVTTSEFPGFPTDLQPQMSALLCTLEGGGTSIINDKVYPDRRSHVAELRRMGAHIDFKEHLQVARGTRLHGAPVRAADIRAGGALVIAALAADGLSVIEGMQYINRGYENLAERLRSLGANVTQAEEVFATAVD